jgi:hypothetical protein
VKKTKYISENQSFSEFCDIINYRFDRKTKMTKYEEDVAFAQSLKELMSLKREEHSYAYTSGYLEMMVATMFRSMPSAQRQIVMREIQKSLESVTA